MDYPSIVSQAGSSVRNVAPVTAALEPLLAVPDRRGRRVLELASYPYEHIQAFARRWDSIEWWGTGRDEGEVAQINATVRVTANLQPARWLDIGSEADWDALRDAVGDRGPFEGVVMLNLIHCCPEGLPEEIFRQLSPSRKHGRALLDPRRGWVAAYGAFLEDDGAYRSAGDAKFDAAHIRSRHPALGLRAPKSIADMAARWAPPPSMAVSHEPARGPGTATPAVAMSERADAGPSRRPSQVSSTVPNAHVPPVPHASSHAPAQSATAPASPQTTYASAPEPAPQFNIATYPTQALLRLLARILQQIATANDHLRPEDDDVDMAEPADDASASASASASARSARSVRSASQHPSPASTLFHGESDGGGAEEAPVADPEALFTASRSSLCVPSSLLSFHARHIPSISIEAYLLRILKYCPTTNEVFLGLLVYFDRMSKLGTPAGVGGLSAAVGPRGFAIDSFNVHRLVIAGVTVASKFFSDVFYTNSRYAKVGGLPPQELNQLELQFLLLNDFRLRVAPEEMQKYGNRLLAYSAGQDDVGDAAKAHARQAADGTGQAGAGATRSPAAPVPPAPGDPAHPSTHHAPPRKLSTHAQPHSPAHSLSLRAAPPRPAAALPRQNVRLASSAPPRTGGLRVSHLFAGLAGLGALVTIYGLLEYYTSLSTWPEPVRTPLKAALKARNRGDYDVARQYFEKAIDAALALPASALGPDPLLKLSGVHISLASMLESQSDLLSAFAVLASALPHFGPAPLAAVPPTTGGWADCTLSRTDVTRAIGIYQKLGQLALRIGTGARTPSYPLEDGRGWDGAAEHYLADAVAAMLRLGLANRAAAGGGAAAAGAGGAGAESPGAARAGAGVGAGSAQPVVAGRDLALEPGADDAGRVDLKGLATTMEGLAEVYARKGEDALAAQLLVQAISILIPPAEAGAAPPSALSTCRAALLMATVSSFALGARSAREVQAARSWAAQALERAAAPPVTADDEAAAVCARARSVGLYNLGMLAEIDKKPDEAARFFTEAARSAAETGFAEGRRRALEALRRVQSGQ
ncbi:cyclin-like protein interacting with PHO85 [Cryptotrichosporon argae]